MLELQNIYKTFEDRTVLADVNLMVPKGGTHALARQSRYGMIQEERRQHVVALFVVAGIAENGFFSRPGDGQLSLKRGSPVIIVVRPAAGETATATEVTGWVFDSSAEALNSRERPVELALPRAQAGLVSAAAADKRISVLALAE